MNGWQPIETAPRVDDYRAQILVAEPWRNCPGRWTVDVAEWSDSCQCWESATNHDGYEAAQLTPTHWMPMPDPPGEQVERIPAGKPDWRSEL